MRKGKAIGAFLALALTSVSAGAAPPSTHADTDAYRVFGGGGWDHAWVFGGGLSRGFVLQPDWLALRVDIEGSFPPLVLEARGYRLESGLTLAWRTPWWVGADLSAAATITSARDVLGARTVLGSALRARPGLYARWFSVGLEVSYDVGLASWTTPSDEVRRLFDDRYQGGAPANAVGPPEPGWMFLTVHVLRAGAFGGVFVFDHVGVWLNGGLEVIPQRQGAVFHAMLGQLGFYSLLGTELAW